MKKAILLLAAGGFLFTACKKDDNTVSRESMVTGKWTIDTAKAGAYIAGQTLFEQDYLENAEACEKDNLLDFVSDHTLYNDEGATKCNASDAQRMQVGTWQLANNEQAIAVNVTSASGTIPAGANTLTIDELTSNHMRLHKDSTTTFNGVPLTITFKMHLHK